MLLEYAHLSKLSLLFIFSIFYGYFIEFIQSITVAHQLPIDILPPIFSKKDKTLWIGGKQFIIFKLFVFVFFIKECFLKQANGPAVKLLFPQLLKH